MTKETHTNHDVIEFYDKYSASWDDRFGQNDSTAHFLEKRWSTFKEILGQNMQEVTALELGVGTGVYIDRTSKIFKQIVAVDGSAGMLAQLKEKLNCNGIQNVSIVQSNVLHIEPVQSGSIDLVYFIGLIEHLLDMEPFFTELKRVLHPGGTVIGICVNASSPWYRIRKFVKGTGKHCSGDKYFKWSEILESFSAHGFSYEAHKYSGGVPPGLQSKLIYRILLCIERIVEKCWFRKYLGTITFKFRKL